MATPTVLSYTVQDDNGVKASVPFYASYDGAVETIDALIGEWLVLGALIDAVTGAKIVSGHIEIPLAREALDLRRRPVLLLDQGQARERWRRGAAHHAVPVLPLRP